jgi:septal ring factor EnvC (AmiA/AmiB activator)
LLHQTNAIENLADEMDDVKHEIRELKEELIKLETRKVQQLELIAEYLGYLAKSQNENKKATAFHYFTGRAGSE